MYFLLIELILYFIFQNKLVIIIVIFFFLSDQIMDDERNQITSTPLINFNEELEKNYLFPHIALHIQLRLILFSFFFTNTLSFNKTIFLSYYIEKEKKRLNNKWIIFWKHWHPNRMIFWIFWTIILENGFWLQNRRSTLL